MLVYFHNFLQSGFSEENGDLANILEECLCGNNPNGESKGKSTEFV